MPRRVTRRARNSQNVPCHDDLLCTSFNTATAGVDRPVVLGIDTVDTRRRVWRRGCVIAADQVDLQQIRCWQSLVDEPLLYRLTHGATGSSHHQNTDSPRGVLCMTRSSSGDHAVRLVPRRALAVMLLECARPGGEVAAGLGTLNLLGHLLPRTRHCLFRDRDEVTVTVSPEEVDGLEIVAILLRLPSAQPG
jgi:hypothetical protein